MRNDKPGNKSRKNQGHERARSNKATNGNQGTEVREIGVEKNGPAPEPIDPEGPGHTRH